MKLKIARPRTAYGALQIASGELRWLVAEAAAEGVPRIVDGGLCALPVSEGPPNAEALLEAVGEPLRSRAIRWSVTAPLRARAEVVTLPMAEGEIEQAGRWQAQSSFSFLGNAIATDFEVLPGQVSAGASPATVTLLVAIAAEEQAGWTQKLTELPRRPCRFEPTATALVRAVTTLRQGSPAEALGQIFAYRDLGDAALLAYRGSQCASARSFGGAHGDSMPPLQGEAGVRAVLETLLSCEDRFPRFAFSGLIAAGQLAGDWATHVAKATQLDVVAAPTPPAGVPAALIPEQRWLVPLGALLGALP